MMPKGKKDGKHKGAPWKGKDSAGREESQEAVMDKEEDKHGKCHNITLSGY